MLGYDYYHWTPFSPEVFGQKLDSSAAVNILEGPDYLSRLINSPFGIEITEMQAEPWGKEYPRPTYPMPGNSAQEFQFSILRCLQVLKDTPSVIRFWGIEWFIQTVDSSRRTAEHNKIIDIVQAINKMHK